MASIIYLIVWINLPFRLQDRELSLSRGFLLTMFLLAIGLVGTFRRLPAVRAGQLS